jgi:hypothetical protein
MSSHSRVLLKVWGLFMVLVLVAGADWPRPGSAEPLSSKLERFAYLSAGLLYAFVLIIPDRWLRVPYVRELKLAILVVGMLWFAYLCVVYTRESWSGLRSWLAPPFTLLCLALTSLAIWTYALPISRDT